MLSFLKNKISISVIDQILISSVNFLIGFYLAYKLGISAFGQYSLILLIMQFCLEIQRSVIHSPMFVFSASSNYKDYLNALYPLQVIVSTLLALLAGIFIHRSGSYFIKWQIDVFAGISIAFIFTRLQQEFYRRYFFASDEPIKSLKLDIAISLLLISGLILLQLSGNFSLRNVLLLGSITSVLPLFFFKIRFSFDENHFKEIIIKHYHFSKWLFSASIVTYFSGNLLIFIGSAIIGNSAAGILKLSQYIMGGMIILYQAAENIIPNKLAYLRTKNNLNNLKIYYMKFLGISILITAMHGLIIYCFMDEILFQLNKGSYSHEQYTIAIGYIGFSFILTIVYSLQYLLRAFHLTAAIFIGSAISAFVIALFGKYLIIRYDTIGIVFGFYLSQAVILIVYALSIIFLLRRHHENRAYCLR